MNGIYFVLGFSNVLFLVAFVHQAFENKKLLKALFKYQDITDRMAKQGKKDKDSIKYLAGLVEGFLKKKEPGTRPGSIS